MRLILLRHGTRDFGLGDVPINSMGLAEAAIIAKTPALSQIQWIYTSPKKRALMTAQPLATVLNITPSVNENFDQMQSGESMIDFRKRIQLVLNDITDSHGSTETEVLVCSHSDWLTVAVDLMTTTSSAENSNVDPRDLFFNCAQHYSFQWKDGLWTLI